MNTSQAMRRTNADLESTLQALRATETQEAAEERLIALHKLAPELFGELSSREGLVARAYDLQAGKVAYMSETGGPSKLL
jgi:hypothetical protein